MVKTLLFNIIFLIVLKRLLFSSSCKPGFNHCLICNYLTNLCSKCENEVYVPDQNGGCKRKCVLGINNCIECSDEGDLCKNCDDGYFLDEMGGCSYTDNCQISENGECLKCKNNFILIGLEESLKICKSLFSEDLKNCILINNETGLCEECKENYYLNSGDKRCSYSNKCFQSVFGKCIQCNNGYYLNKLNDECVLQNDYFQHCKESINGKTCSSCENNYYFNENEKCISINFCSKESSEYNKCEKCISGYYLSENHSSCTIDKNCYSGNKDTGICIECKNGYYIDYKDGNCKSNQEDNDFKYCKEAEDICIECVDGYYIGEDNKCSNAYNCSESINGICIECIDNYYIGLDNKCSIIEHCIYSYYYDYCYECEVGYYYNKNDKKCKNAEGIFKNCKYGNETTYCERCKDDYYLNQTDNLCYNNNNKGPFYKCSITDPNAEYCYICSKNYTIGDIDHKCTNVEGCDLSENEDKCLQCGIYYCLNIKTGKCEYNDRIINEEKKFYYRCNRTNKEGNACEVCIDNYILKDGLCVDEEHCIEKNEDGNCKKCLNDDENSFCLNYDFGCVDLFFDYCLECNDILDLEKCTKCFEGYKINEYDQCDESEIQ